MSKLSGVFSVDGQIEPNGFQRITSLSTVTTLTVPSGSRLCMVQAELAGVRWRDDGTAPDTDTGLQISVGSILWYTADPRNLKFIEDDAGARLNVSYYK